MFAKSSVQKITDQDLHAFVDGELDGRRYREVVQHLATDPLAAERVNGILRQQGGFAFLREHFAEVEVADDETTLALARELAGKVRHQRRVRLGSIASALLLTTLVGSWTIWGPTPTGMRFLNGGPQVLFGSAQIGAQLTAGDLADGMMLEQQLAAYSVQRPDLEAQGLTFVGGNVLTEGHARAFRLVYKDPSARLVYLFVGQVGSDADAALTLVPEGHISLNWRRGPLVFVLIGPKESEQLLAVMESISDSLVPVPTERPVLPAATAVEDVPAEPQLPHATPALAPAEQVVPASPGAPEVSPAVVTDNRPKAL